MKNLSHKQKIYKRMTGPYIITGRSSTGSYYVKDHYGHQMVHVIVPNQLVHFYDNKKYKTSHKGQVVDNIMSDDCTMSDDTGTNVDTECQETNVETEEMEVYCSTCQHADMYVPNPNPKTSTLVKSQQVLIVSNQEVLVSSDELMNIDVGTEMSTLVENQSPIKSPNPWGDKGVHEILIENVDNLNDSEQSTELDGFEKAPPVYFNQLTDEDRIAAAVSFNLKFKNLNFKF